MLGSLTRIGQAVLYVARELDHVLSMASIDNAREAVAEAERKRAIRSVLEGQARPEGSVIDLDLQDEFTDRIGDVQVPVTLGG